MLTACQLHANAVGSSMFHRASIGISGFASRFANSVQPGHHKR